MQDPANLATNPTLEAPALSMEGGWSQSSYGKAEPLVCLASLPQQSTAGHGLPRSQDQHDVNSGVLRPLAGDDDQRHGGRGGGQAL